LDKFYLSLKKLKKKIYVNPNINNDNRVHMVDMMDNHIMNLHTHKSRYENVFLLHQKMKRYHLKVTRGYAGKQRSLERSRARVSFLQELEGENVPFEYVSNGDKFDKVIQKELREENELFKKLYGPSDDECDNHDDSDDDFPPSRCLGKKYSHCCDCIECCGNDWKTRRFMS
jgi:hypothetical protein